MSRQIRAVVVLASLGISLAVQACATAAPSAPYAIRQMQDRVTINNRAVNVGSQRSVLDLLNTHVARLRLLEGTPLVVVDEVPVIAGMDALQSLSPYDVESITTLWPADAIFRFGQRGAEGAIVIVTKKGRSGNDVN